MEEPNDEAKQCADEAEAAEALEPLLPHSSSSSSSSSFDEEEEENKNNRTSGGDGDGAADESQEQDNNNTDARRHHHLHDAPLHLDEVFLDWDALIDPHSSAERLNRYLSVLEVDALAGWATHRDRPYYSNNNHDHNPLFGDGLLPNVPPRSTVVRSLVQDPAKEFCLSDAQDQQQDKGHQRVIKRFRESSSDVSAHPDAKRKCHLIDRFHHSSAVAIAMLAEEAITASLLPLAKRHVQRCRALEDVISTEHETIKEEEDDDDVLRKKAKKHDDDHDDYGVEEEEEEETTADPQERERLVRQARQQASEQWTLPPEEAIQKLLLADPSEEKSESLPVFARAAPPTRTSVAGAPGTSILNQPRPGVREQTAFVAWCHSQQLDPAEVERTVDLAGYRAFVNI